jgi:hypothetical protein
MPSKKASISINLLADATKAKAGFAEAEKAAGGLDKQFGNIAKTAVNAFATREIINFGKGAVNAASDLAESANAVAVTFGEAGDQILKLGENASKAVGLSAKDFNGFAVQFAGFTRQLTTADKDIVDVTDELTVRIADFASVMNLDVPNAAAKFQSALAGSTEPMRAFGIDVSAAAVQTYALENGITDNAKAMTEAEKVQARYGLIMEQTAQMSGDFANTSDGLANSQRILAAELENAKATIGEAMVPALQGLMSAVTPLVEGFTALPKGLQQTIVLAGAGSVGMRTFSNTVQGLGLSAKNATRMTGLLSVSMSGLIVAMGHFAEKQAEIERATQSLNDVLEENAGFLTDAAVATLKYNNLGTDLDKDLQTLGLTFEDLTNAAKGQKDAIDKVANATRYYREISDGFFNIQAKTIAGTEEQITASKNVKRALEGYTQALEDAAYEADRLASAEGVAAEHASSLEAEMRRLQRILDAPTVRNFTEDVVEASTGMSELRKEAFRTDTEFDRLFNRLDNEQAVADFIREIEDANEAMRAAAEGSAEYEQAERDRLFALQDLIEAHSLLDSAFGKELIPLIEMGDVDALEAKIKEILGLIGTIAPNIQAAIDAGSFGMGVLQAGTQGYVPLRPTQAQQAAMSGTIIENVNINMPAGSDGRDVADKLITYSKRNGGVPVANLPGVKY